LAGALGVPYTRNRQYAGATAGEGSSERSSPSSNNEILSCRVGVSDEGDRRVVVHASSGEPGQVLTGAALLRASDVYGKAGLRSGMANLTRDGVSTPVARRFFQHTSEPIVERLKSEFPESVVMAAEEFWIPSARRDIGLHCMEWIPEGEVRMIVQILHGMVECAENYDGLATYLNSHGIAVVGHDHRGHGDTGPVLGIIADSDGDMELVRDAFEVTSVIEERYPGTPIYLLGFSMGSFIARRCVTIEGGRYKGLLALGSGNPPRGFVTALISGIRGLERVYGSDHTGPMIIESTGRLINRIHKTSENASSWCTTDSSLWEVHKDDPRYNFQFTYGAYRDLMTLILRLVDEEDFDRIPKDLPVLFMSGGSDPVGQKGNGVRKAAEILERYGLRPDTIIYEGEMHCFLDGKPGEKSRPDILDWLNRMNNR